MLEHPLAVRNDDAAAALATAAAVPSGLVGSAGGTTPVPAANCKVTGAAGAARAAALAIGASRPVWTAAAAARCPDAAAAGAVGLGPSITPVVTCAATHSPTIATHSATTGAVCSNPQAEAARDIAAAVVSEVAPRGAEELEAHGDQQQQQPELLSVKSPNAATQSPATQPAVLTCSRVTIARAQIHQRRRPCTISSQHLSDVLLPCAFKQRCFSYAQPGSMLALQISVPKGAAALAAVAVAYYKQARDSGIFKIKAAEATAAAVMQASTAAAGAGGRQPQDSLTVSAQDMEPQAVVLLSTIHIQPCCKLTLAGNGSWVVSNLQGCIAPFVGWKLVHVLQVWTLSWLLLVCHAC